MKLSTKHHNGLGKIARYFEKIESIAEDMTESENRLTDSYKTQRTEAKHNQMNIAAKRQKVFRQFNEVNPSSSIVNLNVIVNEDRF